MAHDEAHHLMPPASDDAAMDPSANSQYNQIHQQTLSILERFSIRATESQFNAIAGAIGGFTAGVVTCPLDVIKTKLQAQGGFLAAPAANPGPGYGPQPQMYSGLVGTGKTILRDEGIRGLYRGLGPIVFGYLPTWAVWFTVYNKSKVSVRRYTDHDFFVSFWSSIIAGGCSTIATNPIWVIKTRLMSQSATAFTVAKPGAPLPPARTGAQTPWHYRSSFDAAYKMYTSEGILSFYSGLTPALLGLTHVAVQFPAYEYLRTKFTGYGMASVTLDGQDAPIDQHQQQSHWLGVLAASVISKILASTATYPHEVIRTRLQTQRRSVNTVAATAGGIAAENQPAKYHGVMKTFRTIMREEGWRAFYAGLGTNMMRAVPAATVTMLTYEYCMGEFNAARKRGMEKSGRGIF